MAAKEVKFEIDARTRMLKGVDILANAVKVLSLIHISEPTRPERIS